MIKNPKDGQFIQVRCNKCLACLKHRQSEWISRFREQTKGSKSCYFVTLTYEEEKRPKLFDPILGYSDIPTVCKAHVIKFFKDMRKRFQQGFFYDSSLKDLGFLPSSSRIELPSDCRFKYYLTSEYGSLGVNPHYHAIIWDLPEDENLVFCLIRSLWPYGFVTVYASDEDAAAAYVAKYLINDSLVPSQGLRPFALMSKGIGKCYLDNEKKIDWHRQDPVHRCYIPNNGTKSVLPRYFRNFIFNDDMKDAIATVAYIQSERKIYEQSKETLEEGRNRRKSIIAHQKEAERQALWNFQKKNKIK